jgi:hypothetical protein
MTARSNGLRASAYAILLEIEESLGDPLLAALAAREIAAYVEPVPGPGGTTRLTLYVDVLQRAPAGVVLAGLTPAMAGDPPGDGEPPREGAPAARQISGETPGDPAGSDDDAAFAALVEAFHRTPGERTWPDAEDLPAGPVPPESASPRATALPSDTVLPAMPPRRTAKKFDPRTDVDRRRPIPPIPPVSPVSPDAVDSADDVVESDAEEHYIPPPLPRLDPPPFATRWALVGLVMGLALLLVPTLLDFGHRTSLDIAGVVCVLGSGAVLISRLRDRSPEAPDDGAVV